MLIVTKSGEEFVCNEQNAVGAYLEGRGASVLEAVGSWAVYSSTVKICCDPPELLQEFSVDLYSSSVCHNSAPERS